MNMFKFILSLCAVNTGAQEVTQRNCEFLDLPLELRVPIVCRVIREYQPKPGVPLWGTVFRLLGRDTILGDEDIKQLYRAIAKNPVTVNYDIYKLDRLLPSTPDTIFFAMNAFRNTAEIYPEYFEILAKNPRLPFMTGLAQRSSTDVSTIAGSFLFRALMSSLHRKAGNRLWKYLQQHPEIIGYDTNNIASYLEKRDYSEADNYVLASYAPYPDYPKDSDQETRERIMEERDKVQEMNTKAAEKLKEEFKAFNEKYARERAVIELLNKGSITDRDLQKVIDIVVDESTFLMSLFRDKKPIIYRICACCDQPGTNFDTLAVDVDYAAQAAEGNPILVAAIRAGKRGVAMRVLEQGKGEININAQNPVTGNTALMEAAMQIFEQPMFSYNFECMIEDLLTAGALDLPNKQGLTLFKKFEHNQTPFGQRIRKAILARNSSGTGCILS